MRKFTGIVLSLALIFAVKIPARAELAVSAKAAILMHADSGRVLYEKNADEHMLIASTTKIMTAIVVLEHCELDDLVEVDSRSAGIEGSSMYLKAGESYTVEDLLYGLLLVSGNDAASALALHVADSMEEFAELMNAKAAELGMTESSFKNAHGLDEEGHYSTARDMAKLAAYCMGNEDFARIAGTVSHTVGEQTLVNHNRLLREYDGCLGLKTGYTMAAGRTLVTCAERDGARYVCVTLNDPDDWDDHKALYDWAFANYSFAEVIPAGLSYEVPLISGAEMTAPAGDGGRGLCAHPKRRELRHGARAARLCLCPDIRGRARGPGRGLLGRAGDSLRAHSLLRGRGSGPRAETHARGALSALLGPHGAERAVLS